MTANQGEGVRQTPPENQAKAGKKKPRKPKTLPLENRLLTVDQYLAKAEKEKPVEELLRSMYRTRIMSFADWNKETAALLQKKVW